MSRNVTADEARQLQGGYQSRLEEAAQEAAEEAAREEAARREAVAAAARAVQEDPEFLRQVQAEIDRRVSEAAATHAAAALAERNRRTAEEVERRVQATLEERIAAAFAARDAERPVPTPAEPERAVRRSDVTNLLVQNMTQNTALLERLANPPKLEGRVEGISMPTYSGRHDENLDLFCFQARVYLAAKNINHREKDNQARCLNMMVANLRGVAAAWYQDRVKNCNAVPTSIGEFESALRQEFVPPDAQERYRDQLYNLHQRNFRSLEEYVAAYRQVIVRVNDMSQLDRVMLFTRGLRTRTREEVQYRRSTCVSDAIAVALEFERTHPSIVNEATRHDRGRGGYDRTRGQDGRVLVNYSAMRGGQGGRGRSGAADPYVQEARSRGLCFNCHSPSHQSRACPAPRRNGRQQPMRQNNLEFEVHDYSDMTSESFDREEHVEITTVELSPADDEVEDLAPRVEEIEINTIVVRPEHVTVGVTGVNDLFTMPALVNGQCMTVLLDSGADHNVITPGVGRWITATKTVTVTGFGSASAERRRVHEVSDAINMGGHTYTDVVMTEWDMTGKPYQMILGKPWFAKYNPVIDWRRHRIVSVEATTRDEVICALEAAETPTVRAPAVVAEQQRAHHAVGATAPDAVDAPLPPTRAMTSAPEAVSIYFSQVPAADGSIETYVKVTSVKQREIPAPLAALVEEYKDVFPDEIPAGLPPSRVVDFAVEMKADAKPPRGTRPMRLSLIEQQLLDAFVDKLTSKGWVRVSNSPWVASVFGVPKKGDDNMMLKRAQWLKGLTAETPVRWVLDYRYVNSQQVVPRIPLPIIEDLFDRLWGVCIFTVMDMMSGYHQMLVDEASRKYTAFRTHKETYEWCVAPMGMAGTPGYWTRLMTSLFGHLPFCVIYMDDMAICSRTMDEHVTHVATVLKLCRDAKLYVNLDKCEFGVPSISFLGHEISAAGLAVCSKKVRAIERWGTPSNRKELLSFLGLAGYYRKFICDYAEIVRPMAALTKEKTPWAWGAAQAAAFSTIKLALQQAPVLAMPALEERFIVTTDASAYCVGAVLSQLDAAGDDRPIAFLSKKLGAHEVNWPAYEQELYAIKVALTKWRHYLLSQPFDVYTDNSACRWFLTTQQLNPKMTRWLDFFSQFSFEMHHRPGVQNVVADALSRPPVPASAPVVDAVPRPAAPVRVVSATAPALADVSVNTARFATEHACDAACVERGRSVQRHRARRVELQRMSEPDRAVWLNYAALGEETVAPVGQRQVHVVNHVAQVEFSSVAMSLERRQAFKDGYRRDASFTTDATKYERANGFVYLRTSDQVWRLCVPDDEVLRTALIADCHDGPLAAHPGVRRTQLLVKQWYYWPSMAADIELYVTTCETCARYKSNTRRANGLMMPIEVPTTPWHTVTIDWIGGLPVSNGFDSIMTVVDKLSKRSKYVATHTTTDAPKAAREFFDHVVRHHGLPKRIISDRDPRFTSEFWTALMGIMGVKHSKTTSHRAQADGQSERQNRTVEDSLRCMCSYLGSDWSTQLATIEYAHMGLVQGSTGLTPFEIDTGRQLANPVLPEDFPGNDFARQFAENRQRVIAKAIENNKKAQDRQKKYYDKSRADVSFAVGDYTYLATRDLPLRHASNTADGSERPKLVPRYVGPFKVVGKIGANAYKLDLPPSMRRMHPVFNVDRLKASPGNPEQFQTRPLPKATPVLFDEDTGEQLYIVEKLLAARHVNRQREYLVQWHGLPRHEASWERERSIKHVAHWQRLTQDLRARQARDRDQDRQGRPRRQQGPVRQDAPSVRRSVRERGATVATNTFAFHAVPFGLPDAPSHWPMPRARDAREHRQEQAAPHTTASFAATDFHAGYYQMPLENGRHSGESVTTDRGNRRSDRPSGDKMASRTWW